MTSKRSKFKEDTNFRVFRLLQENPKLSQRELAKVAGVSVGSMHYVLSAFVEKGFVKLGDFTASQDKRRCAYIITPSGINKKAILAPSFLLRNMEEYEALRQEIKSLQLDLDESETKVRF